MERQKPDAASDAIALYLRTIYSLLRSSGDVTLKALEEAHTDSQSSLHAGARDPRPDVGAFGYAAARLPACMPAIRHVVLGQSDGTFEALGYDVSTWSEVTTRGRRRHLRYDGNATLAAYIASVSDIDDLLPILVAYQIEWNKLHMSLVGRDASQLRDAGVLAQTLGITEDDAERIFGALGSDVDEALAAVVERELDVRVRLLTGSFSAYQRAADLWWDGVARAYVGDRREAPPVYFVSSNTHALPNLLGGYARAHEAELLAAIGPAAEPSASELAADPNRLYFALRDYLRSSPQARERVAAWDSESGLVTTPNLAHVDVGAQVIELARLQPARLDPRLDMPGLERLRDSDACIINIDYPLGMAAYHLLSRLARGAGSLLGVYVMGKAATLNAQVGDVMISRVVHDEHSENTYLLHNAFTAGDVAPYLRDGSVLDNQKAVTVRGAFLQSASYMGVFYREGYTVLEMEAGPYCSAVYELADPRRHPNDELVDLVARAPFDLGILHYVSDTPRSRRQWLLSKSLGLFGMDSTYACAIAILRRILAQEIRRLGG